MFITRRHRASTRGAVARRLLTAFVATATVTGSLSLAAAFADGGGPYDITVSGTSGFNSAPTTGGALVSYYGSASTQATALGIGSSGTGVFEPFYRLQGSPTEAGYNTDGTPELDTGAGLWTHSMKVSDIPVVEQNGQRYFELWADLNENNSTPRIDLTDMQVYFTPSATLTGYPFPAAAATQVYNFSGDIQIRDVNQGSGRADLRYLVPLSNITIPSGCSYGSSACSTYFVLYSKFGNTDPAAPGASDGGFEEWKVRSYPFLNVTKTANTSYTRTYGWSIAKSASPTSLDLNDGQSGSTTWTVGVTKDAGTDSAWDVSGTITVANPSGAAATVSDVRDTLSADGSVTIQCGAVTFPTTLSPGDSFQCTYDKQLSGPNNQTNTATAVLDSGAVYDGTAAVTFGAPTTVLGDAVDVTDTNGNSWNFTGTGSVQYDQTFTCGQDAGHHVNTATITQTGASAQASVDVTCHSPLAAPTGMKSATPTHSELVKWTIEKTVENGGPQTHDLNLGTVNGPQTVSYHVTATKRVSNETFGLTGTIEVSNSNPTPLDVTLADTGLSPAVASSSCTLASPSGMVPAATASGPGTRDFDYTCAFPSAFPVVGTPYTNSATITYTDPRFATTPVSVTSGSIVFPAPSLQQGSDQQSVTVDDPKAPVSAGFPKTISDTTTFPVFQMTYADHGSVAESNTASFTAGATGSDTATVEYDIPAPVVPLVPLAVTCSTGVTSLSLPVGNNGRAGTKTLQDVVMLSGLPAGKTTTVTAVLYGPSATSGVRGNTVVATQTFQAGNGKTLTAPVQVDAPGYYTWEISTPGSTSRLQTPLNRLCSDASQTALVHRAEYAIVHVPTGFTGPVAGAADRSAPTTLVIPALGIRATVATATLNHGSLKVPAPNLVGWVNKSAAPSDLIGTTVIAGHVSDNRDRPGALFNLHKIRRGQVIEIVGPNGVQRFRVTAIRTFSRNRALPASLFDTTAAHRLALVTCTDKVVRGGFFHYTRNLVVIATPIP